MSSLEVSAPTSESHANILLVEDNIDLRDTVVDLLEVFGYRVECASNGGEALDRLHSGSCHPCLILLDWMMPVMAGEEFLRRFSLVPEWSEIPVVVVSAVADLVKQLHDNHVAGILKKPTDLEQLLQAIYDHCD